MARSLRRAKRHQEQKERGSEEDLTWRLVTTLDSTSGASEAFRTLRTNVLYALVDNPPKVIVLTSPGPGEGKTTTCANLGVVLAQQGKNVLLLDCDFRKPLIHKLFGLRNLQGIMDVLVGECSLQDVWKEPVDGLKVVPVGPIPLDPAEIIGSRRFSKLLTEVRDQFDYVLIDTAPVEVISDGLVIATQGDGVLLVLDAQSTRKKSLQRALRSLRVVGAPILGTIMNNVKSAKDSYYSDNYRYVSK